jgi:hypothetical protein
MARYEGATLNLTPWAHEALSLADQRELGRRLVRLHARAGVLAGKPGRWTFDVSSWEKDPETKLPVRLVERRNALGNLADLLHGAIDEYERRYVWTAEELVTIAGQSGLAVRRG